METIYSAVVYSYEKQAGRRIIFVKAPCTSKKAAIEYAKVLRIWWEDKKKGIFVTIEKDFVTNYKIANRLLNSKICEK